MRAKLLERKIAREYKMSRKEALNKVSIIIFRLIEMFTFKQTECIELNLASLLFNDQIFLDIRSCKSSYFNFYGSKKS